MAKGEVTRSDYTDFTGYAGAMWENGKFGTEYLSSWERIEVVTDTPWVRHTVGVFGHLMPARIRVFGVAEEADASEWVTDP